MDNFHNVYKQLLFQTQTSPCCGMASKQVQAVKSHLGGTLHTQSSMVCVHADSCAQHAVFQ